MLKVLVAIMLVIVSVQCAAACTPVSGAQPSCHHHKEAPACKHELVPAVLVPSVAIGTSLFSKAMFSQAIDAPVVLLGFVPFDIPAIENPSPPGPPVPLLTVLRI